MEFCFSNYQFLPVLLPFMHPLQLLADVLLRIINIAGFCLILFYILGRLVIQQSNSFFGVWRYFYHAVKVSIFYVIHIFYLLLNFCNRVAHTWNLEMRRLFWYYLCKFSIFIRVLALISHKIVTISYFFNYLTEISIFTKSIVNPKKSNLVLGMKVDFQWF